MSHSAPRPASPLPTLPALPPLRTDATNAFAHRSMRVRVPRIARDTLAQNPQLSPTVRDAIERLAAEIESDAPLPAPLPPGPDLEGWTRACAERAGESWLNTEWFHAELAFYRELTRRCRFWELGVDPFRPAKEEELASERPWERLALALARRGSREDRIFALLDDSLWGNRVDLSYTVGAARGRADDDLIADERSVALPHLARRGAPVHLVADNTGAELALDLALADAVLEDPAATVTLHVKMEPIFVSDAMAADVWRLLERMAERPGDCQSLSGRLATAFAEQRFALAPDPFWSGPRFLREAPAHLLDTLATASIVVIKGDANYRRVVGDALWPPAEPFASACAFARSPLVCLRTMKSDPVLGLAPGLAEKLDGVDPEWRIDGRRGVVQAYVP